MILEEFDEDKQAIINPTDIYPQQKDFPVLCVSCFTRSIVEKFSNLDHVRKIKELTCANGKISIYAIKVANIDIAFYMSPIGASACVGIFEELIALGVKKMVLFGSCGVLNHKIADGHIILPNRAVRDEGCSYHYLPASTYIDMEEDSFTKMKETLDFLSLPYVTGTTWTTDAFYRETKKKMEKRLEQGCICVEMECAAMMAVAKFRNVTFAQFLFAADNLDDIVWNRRGLHVDQGLEKSDVYMEVAVECVMHL